MSSQAQGKNFLFHRKNAFRFQDIQVFVFLVIPSFTKSVTSQRVLERHNAFLNISFEAQFIKSLNLTSR